MPILGYKNNTVNTLTLWDAEALNKFDLNSFDRGDYFKAVEAQNLAETITQVLYPNDNHYQGKELRLKQQYFFVSASLQRAIKNYKKNNSDAKKQGKPVSP
jgi:starch phosphorylase